MRLIDADKLMENKFKNDISYNAFCNLVKRQPSIDAVKHGRWIGGELGHCSCCGHHGCASDIWSGCDDGMFCPNCGADMRGEQDG